MSKVSVELNDVKLNIFKKGNFVVSNDRKIVVLVTSNMVNGSTFSGVCIYCMCDSSSIGEYSNVLSASKFNGLFEGKIIIE